MSNEVNNTIKLYPSNWLITAGIVGFVRIFEDSEFYKLNENNLEILDFNKLKEEFFEKYFKLQSDLKIPLQIFYNNSRVSNNRFKKSGENTPDIHQTTKYFFGEDKKENDKIENDKKENYKIENSEFLCSFCNERKAIKRNNKPDNEPVPVVLDEIHFTPLASSPKNLANFYWEGKPSNFMCLPCELIIYCAAFGFTKVYNHKEDNREEDNSYRYVFINAPANLKEIVEINNIWKEYLEQKNEKGKSFKASVIEILKKIEKTKAKWTLQNISFIELSPFSESRNSFNVYSFNIPVETANAVRKMIQSFPNDLKDIYDIFIDHIYSKKPLYDMVGNILYGYLNEERLKNIKDDNLEKSSFGRMILSGKKLEDPKDLLFFLKFQKEVEEYEQ